MHYRIFDTEMGHYLSTAYNESNQKEFKQLTNSMLSDSVSDEDLNELNNLKWDQYVVRLRKMGLEVEESAVPFSLEELEDWDDWNDVDDYGFDVDEDWGDY